MKVNIFSWVGFFCCCYCFGGFFVVIVGFFNLRKVSVFHKMNQFGAWSIKKLSYGILF